MPRIGEVVSDKYELVRLLGKGGMGVVYEALHTKIGKRVAIKFLHPQYAHVPTVVTRFTREAQAAAAIGHPSIIEIFDCGEARDGSSYLVMELLKGRNLGDLLKQQGVLPPEQVAYVTAQTLSALAAAHQAGIIHRDLKPDNIFLVEKGQKLPEVKLLDFGISKMAPQGSFEDRLTQTGALLGTPFYLSPEMVQGARDVDHRADLYAMGVIMYEACTGRPPFRADHAYALVYEILSSPLIPPRQLRPDLPEALEPVILKALNRERERRYPNAAEMLGDLLPLMDESARDRVSLPAGMTLPMYPIQPEDPTERDPLILTPSLIGQTDLSWSSGQKASDLPRRTRKRLILGVAASAMVLAGVVAMVIALEVTRDTRDATPPVSVSAIVSSPTPSPVPPATKVPPPPTPTPPAAKAQTTPAPPQAPPPEIVAISLTGLPNGARVFLEGSPVGEPTLRAPRSSDPREVRVESEGYHPWRELVLFEEDRTLEVSLRPVIVEQKVGVPSPPRTPRPRPGETPFASDFE